MSKVSLLSFPDSDHFVQKIDFPNLKREIKKIDKIRNKSLNFNRNRTKSPYFVTKEDIHELSRRKRENSFSKNQKESSKEKKDGLN